MRLLRAETLQFEEFIGDDIPEYAILSHCWEQDELSYQDMCRVIENSKVAPGMRDIQEKQGFRKSYSFSHQALKDGYEYVWADTCCIDKSSSAELQEAINSMYRWYESSRVCSAYLFDVSIPSHSGNLLGRGLSAAGWIKSFKASRWFTRGWTLQELLAPWSLIFFNQSWKKCGTASDLYKVINAITGIDVREVVRGVDRDARRMSWAANRQTTLIEDRAYSLLGLFDVNMPLLYGEGERAFQRLQEEIIKVDEDVSILAWSSTEAETGFAPSGLARSPTRFHKYSDLVDLKSARLRYVGFNPTLIPRDLNEQALAYAVLMTEGYQRSKWSKSLILPIMFPELTFLRSDIENECIRFSNPFWVPSAFVAEAEPEPVCFIRQVQAADVNPNSDGLSLCSTVWKGYVTTFTYPVQTQPGRRHFPALFGGFSKSSGWKKGGRIFILELAARAQAAQRFVVLVEYQLKSRKMVEGPTVTVIRLQRAINLAYAAKLARLRKLRCGFTLCCLTDCNSNTIPTDEIVCVSSFHSYWIHTRDDDFEKLPVRPVREPATKAFCAVRKLR
ncbi:heterokaryon incompatibility protein-domain-containing protein [Thelonectria olida]|uniref:Heterokaryon incompatibility protein-domain-containing protein n=1 Tax=Thelonectria olida TaxID=1576542 RepID=A0A9P8VSW1_9HYPO|nr:heterokaryon incompatibility protein-domain-containing protein [Thelonectria olida]